jgi:hypothetical protein
MFRTEKNKELAFVLFLLNIIKKINKSLLPTLETPELSPVIKTFKLPESPVTIKQPTNQKLTESLNLEPLAEMVDLKESWV